jgi:hypothetical protein
MPCAITAARACGPRKAQGSRVYSYLGMWPGNSLGAGRPALTPNVGSRKGWLDRPRAVGPAFAGWARKHRSARSMPGMRRGPSRATSRRWGADHRWRDSRGCRPAAPEKRGGRVVANRKFEREGTIAQSAPGTRTPPRQLWKGSCGGVLLDRPARLWGDAGRTVPT